MSHPVTMLTSGRPLKLDKGGTGNVPSMVATDVAAACAVLRGPFEYWSVMTMVAAQHPSQDQAELVIQELQNYLLNIWLRQQHPRSLRADLVRPLVELAWAEHCSAQPFTQHTRARITGMSVDNWRKAYDKLYLALLAHIENAAFNGMRRVSRQLKQPEAREHFEQLIAQRL